MRFLKIIPFLMLINTAYATQQTFTFKNNSSFYINSKDSGAGCPSQIPPGGTAQSTEYWCGFVACATPKYDKEQGCMEKSNDTDTGFTQGGYATWFSISFGNNLCTVPDGNIYQCSLKNNTLDFAYKVVTQLYSAGDHKGEVVTLNTPTVFKQGPLFRGVNLSGLEYDGTFLDAMYQHPDIPDVRYFVDQGMNIIRLPIRWEFVLSAENNLVESSDPTSSHPNTMYLDAVYDTVQKYLASGLAVDIDLHNYMRFCKTGADVGQANEPTDPVKNNCTPVTGDQLAYIWDVIAKRFAPLAKQYPDHLMFEIMNEPYTFVDNDGKPVAGQIVKTEDLFNAEMLAVNSIRKYAKDNYILLSGNYWDPLHDWITGTPIEGDVPNGSVFNAARIRAAGVDLNRIIIDMHQYFDYNYSGTHQECKKFSSYTQFKQVMGLEDSAGNPVFSKWIKDNNMKIFLGEFGASSDQNCKEDLSFMLKYVTENAYDANNPNNGGFIGWTAWRTNRHTGSTGFSPFNYLQKEDYTVYGGNGSEPIKPDGTGIVKGLGNSLMLPDPVFSFADFLKNNSRK
jgi:endoglucanase